MTKKIFECTFNGVTVEITYHDGKMNPFGIYRKYWDHGWHKRQLVRYNSFSSCLDYINQYYRDHTNVYGACLA